GGNGGGVAKVSADTILLRGYIRADGDANAATSSGGAGGALEINARRVSGSGVISAAGANAINGNGGGAGGRVALYYTDISEFGTALANMTAVGGTCDTASTNPDRYGGAGTVYLEGTGRTNGEVIVRNPIGTGAAGCIAPTPLPELGTTGFS